MSDGVWVKIWPENYDPSGAPGAAVINDAASNYDNKDAGVVIDGKTYDIYTFTTATTTRSVRLTDEAQSRITDEDLLMAVATTAIPDDFTGDPATLFDEKYRKQLRNAFEITPAVDPGLTLDVDTAGIVDVLVVGAGGAGSSGAYYGAGGGGAGGCLQETVFVSDMDSPHAVTVGAGALAGETQGATSSVFSLFAFGGGLGGGYDAASQGGYYTGISGSSGGGGNVHTNPSRRPGLGVPGQGNDGGWGYNVANHGNGSGGGGGAASTGGDGQGTVGGDGGEGVDYSSFIGQPPSTLVLAGGGGGAGSTDGKGGSNVGGDAGKATGQPGEINTGSGGGGSHNSGAACQGGAGGSGIVIVRVEI